MKKEWLRFFHMMGAFSTGLLGSVIILLQFTGNIPAFTTAKWIVTGGMILMALSSHVVAASR